MMHHRANLISEAGVSALCFKNPRPIRLDRGESWVLIDANVDCPKCKKIIGDRVDPGAPPKQPGELS